MLLAINYSIQAATLLKEGKIQINRFKCPDWTDMVAEASRLCPVAVHFNLRAGHGRLANTNWKRASRFLEITGTPYLNLHLETRQEDIPEYPLDSLDPHVYEQVYQLCLTDVQEAIREFGTERVILENVPYRGKGSKVLRPVVEPKFIRQLLDDTGCGLLLDISHARISAAYIGMAEQTYITQLPIERLRELHFTGVHNINGKLTDHLEALTADWFILDWVLERIQNNQWAKPWLLAFEYGGVGEKFAWRSNPQVIAEQVPRLYESIKKIS